MLKKTLLFMLFLGVTANAHAAKCVPDQDFEIYPPGSYGYNDQTNKPVFEVRVNSFITSDPNNNNRKIVEHHEVGGWETAPPVHWKYKSFSLWWNQFTGSDFLRYVVRIEERPYREQTFYFNEIDRVTVSVANFASKNVSWYVEVEQTDGTVLPHGYVDIYCGQYSTSYHNVVSTDANFNTSNPANAVPGPDELPYRDDLYIDWDQTVQRILDERNYPEREGKGEYVPAPLLEDMNNDIFKLNLDATKRGMWGDYNDSFEMFVAHGLSANDFNYQLEDSDKSVWGAVRLGNSDVNSSTELYVGLKKRQDQYLTFGVGFSLINYEITDYTDFSTIGVNPFVMYNRNRLRFYGVASVVDGDTGILGGEIGTKLKLYDNKRLNTGITLGGIANTSEIYQHEFEYEELNAGVYSLFKITDNFNITTDVLRNEIDNEKDTKIIAGLNLRNSDFRLGLNITTSENTDTYSELHLGYKHLNIEADSDDRYSIGVNIEI